MRLAVLPFLSPLLLITACKDAGSDDMPTPASVPTPTSVSTSAPVPSMATAPVTQIAPRTAASAAPNAPEVRIAGEAPPSKGERTKTRTLLPLARILEIARGRVPGEVIDVDFDEDDGVAEYEVEILTPAGRKIEIRIDAHRGSVLEVEGD